MTAEEKRIYYDFLWRLPMRVKRQEQFGDYHADFYIDRLKTVIEIDGSQHGIPEQSEHDMIRTEYLKERGVQVVRIKNDDIRRRFNDVCNQLLYLLKIDPLSLKPPRTTSKVFKAKDQNS